MTTFPPHAGTLNILVVDDEINIRKTLTICLESQGHRVTALGNVPDALAEAALQRFDLAFLDMRLGSDNGLEAIPGLLARAPWLKIVVITAYATIDTAVAAMRRGATDYMAKPFTPNQVEVVTRRIAEVRAMENRIATLQDDLHHLHPEPRFISAHPGMQRALELAKQVARSEAILLLRGTSGSGKSILARAIHAWSHRAQRPLAIISCPTLSPELLESELFGHLKGSFTGAVRDQPGRIAACDGGTLFLDEIGDLPLSIQPKLLRFLQDREYERLGESQTRRADLRVIAATNVDLEEAIRMGRFREDLYYRLNVIAIDLPPLRERPDDVEAIAHDMLFFFSTQNHKQIVGFTPEALRALRGYPWPGNLRELRNVVERAAILCPGDRVGVELLPGSLSPRPTDPIPGDPVSLAQLEEIHIRRVLSRSKSLQEAADILGIDQATLWRKRKNYGID